MLLHKQLDNLPVKYQDFVGFSFDSIHSSKLGILRTSEGDNYEESLLPDFEDSTSDVKGISGQYYFGQQHKAKHIKISIGFDNMTELQFREFRRLLSVDRPCPLIFDERPYKTYMAKIESVPELSYVCFDESKKTIGAARPGVRIINRDSTPVRETVYPYEYEYDTESGEVKKQRIYKGTGTIEFICYYPYAKSTFKILEDYESEDSVPGGFTNIEEWKESSGIMTSGKYDYYNIDKMITDNVPDTYVNQINLYNPGDLDAPFKLLIPYHNNGNTAKGTLSPAGQQDTVIKVNLSMLNDFMLEIKPITAKSNFTDENGIVINTYNHLIEGARINFDNNTYELSGNTYNEFIISGDFGKIEKSAFYPYENLTQAIYTNIALDSGKEIKIVYDYLYY